MCAAAIGRPGAHLSPCEGWSSHFVCIFTIYLHFQTFSPWTRTYFSINCSVPSRHLVPTANHKFLPSCLAQSMEHYKWSRGGSGRPDLLVELNVSGACLVSAEDTMYQAVLKHGCYFDRMFQIAKLNSRTWSD